MLVQSCRKLLINISTTRTKLQAASNQAANINQSPSLILIRSIKNNETMNNEHESMKEWKNEKMKNENPETRKSRNSKVRKFAGFRSLIWNLATITNRVLLHSFCYCRRHLHSFHTIDNQSSLPFYERQLGRSSGLKKLSRKSCEILLLIFERYLFEEV